jgi:hypothetical protein
MIKYLIDLPLLLLYAAALAGWLHRVIPQGGVNVAANGDDMTETTDPMKVAMRQIAGAFAQLEKARLVAKLKAARERKREANGKREGRKSFCWPLVDIGQAQNESTGFCESFGRPYLRTDSGLLHVVVGWPGITRRRVFLVRRPLRHPFRRIRRLGRRPPPVD